jgi:hypothetical protein
MIIFFLLAVDADVWACHNFFGMKLASPELLEPINNT